MLTAGTVALIAAIGAVITVPVTSFLKRENWNASVKQVIAAVVSFAVSAVAIEIKQPSAFGLGLVEVAGLIFAASQGLYAAFRGSVLDNLLTKMITRPPVTPVAKMSMSTPMPYPAP